MIRIAVAVAAGAAGAVALAVVATVCGMTDTCTPSDGRGVPR